MTDDAVVSIVLLVAAGAAVVSFGFAFLSSRLAHRIKAVDMPSGGRKIHTRPIPLLGGVGIGAALLPALAATWSFGWLPDIRGLQLVGFAAAAVILVIGGIVDDVSPKRPSFQVLFPIGAALLVLLTGTGIIQITNPFGGGAIALDWWRIGPLTLPSDLLTFFWLLFATYATKFLDGLDGLVAGMAVIGSAMVGALTLSPAYFQPGVAVLAGAVGGSFLGFLPHNAHPARQFLGEAGSTLAGFTLGFLAIVSSAKVAVALAVLAIPLMDAVIVILGRLRRGVAPWKGDDTHLHFRLLRAGIPHRRAVGLLWSAAFIAGLAALSLQTRGKIFLLAVLATLTVAVSWLLNRLVIKRHPPA